jgi:glyoxylase-like metal-dependent hydrolase (beta-lactamase superfamily II)
MRGDTTPTLAVDGRGRHVEVHKLSVGPMDNNVYILRDPATDEALLIDAADEPDRLLAALQGTHLTAILTTHGHRDHWQALDTVADATGAATFLHPADAGMVPRAADRPVEDDAQITWGTVAARMLHTPGHTPGSTCVLLGERVLFTGDTLFPGGPGNTRGSATAFATIMRSLRDRLFVLPDETRVYPGHGDDTTIGAERPHLDEWQARGW